MKIWNGYVLGRVRQESSSIYINSQSAVQVMLEMLSKPPQSYNGDTEIHAFTNSLTPLGFEDDEFKFTSEQRISATKEFLEDSLLFFKIEQTTTGYYRVHSLDMRSTKLNIPIESFYHTNPLFNESSIGSLKEVLHKLNTRKILGDHKDYSIDAGDYPQHIFYRSLENELYAIGPIHEQRYTQGGFRYVFHEDQVHFTKISEELKNKIYFFNDLAFVPDSINTLIQDFLSAEEAVTEKSIAAIVSNTLVDHQAQLVTQENKAFDVSPKNEEEALFLTQLQHCLMQQNLHYNEQDLQHFHTTLKANGLTILSGISGTGKSKLAQVYSEALGLKTNHFKMVPVAPSWLDETDLLGYVDTQQRRYIPAATGLASLLLEAEKYPQQTFVVCFDEMNLAKVEHYFSQFLSVLEMDLTSPNRQIRLYSEELEAEITNANDFPSNIRILDNLIFIGTVNTDETVHRFSDKVLDRSHIIQLKVEPFNLMMYDEEINCEPLHLQSFHLKQFTSAKKGFSLTQQQIDFLWELNELLNDTSANFGFGPRIVKQINNYMANVTESTSFFVADAFDLQITARILPKLRGSEEVLKTLIGQFDSTSKITKNSSLVGLFNRYNMLSHFERSLQLISMKSKELSNYGYTM